MHAVANTFHLGAVLLVLAMFAGCVTGPRANAGGSTPAATLDQLHDAASKSDEARYFGLFAKSGSVFLGTDATERWDRAAFVAFARPYFQQGKGWTYMLVPGSRSVSYVSGSDVAYFDELLENAKLGTCRGSGVLVIEDGAWKVAQYNLSMPVPNDKAEAVVNVIRGRE